MPSSKTSEGSSSEGSENDEIPPGSHTKTNLKSSEAHDTNEPLPTVDKIKIPNSDKDSAELTNKELVPKDTDKKDRNSDNSENQSRHRKTKHERSDKDRRRSRSPREDNDRRRSRSPRDEKRERRRRHSRTPTKSSRNEARKSSKTDDTEKKSDRERGKQMLTTKTGGAYIPPAKLRLMQEQITDKSSEQFQRLAWEALKKSINGLINKVNSPNIGIIVREIFSENIVRGRGLLCLSIMQAQTASPTFTHVYAALGSIVNSKFPNIGELLLKRLIVNFKRGYKRNDKIRCVSSTRFIAHLVNQEVAHEVLALEILTLLLESPTDDSVEIAISFLKECGQKLTEVSPRGIHAIFERLRNVLHESKLDKRTQYMIEVMHQVRKDGFKDNVAVPEGLDLVEEEDQFTHMFTLDDASTGEEVLNVFKHDPDYEGNEDKFQAIKKELLGEDDSGDSGDSSSEGSDGSDSEKQDKDDEDTSAPIIDQTETNMIALRRTIYLTIQSSLDFEETVHKLMKLNLKPGHEPELCHMVIDCCAQQRTYEKFFGLTAQRLCIVKREYIEPFQNIFQDCYSTVHRLELGKLRNIARVFAHLFFTDAISWETLSCIHLNEHETTSSSRIFIKILFQELAEYMGLGKLNDRIRDATLQSGFDGLFPRDDPANTRFSINFFTNIGLGGLTEDLRNHLKSNPKPIARVAPIIQAEKEKSSSTSSSSSSSSEESESESEKKKKKKERKRKKKQKKKKKSKKRKKASSSEEESDGELEVSKTAKRPGHTLKDPEDKEDYMSMMMKKIKSQKDRNVRDTSEVNSSYHREERREKGKKDRHENAQKYPNRDKFSPSNGKEKSRTRYSDSEGKNHDVARDRSGKKYTSSSYSRERTMKKDNRPRSVSTDSSEDKGRVKDGNIARRNEARNSRRDRVDDRNVSTDRSRRERSNKEYHGYEPQRNRSKEDNYSNQDSHRRRTRSRSVEKSRRRKRSRDRSSSGSVSSDEERRSDRGRDRNSNGRDKESRWAKKEKEWKDPLLPKSNTVYKDKLTGMLELLKQDADIKRQKEIADNPDKAQALAEQVGKMEKSGMKKPSENRPGDWKCCKKGCGNINFAWRKTCNNCETEKPQNAEDYIPEEEIHEHASWFVGAIKTEKEKIKTGHQNDQKNYTSKARDEDSSSGDERPNRRNVSTNNESTREERNSRMKNRDNEARHAERNRSRDRDRHSHRREHYSSNARH